DVVVKCPMTAEGLQAVRQLHEEGIKTNVTLIFSPNQALLAAKAGADYASPFIGRLDDVGHEGMKIIEETLRIYQNYGLGTQVLVASIPHPVHVVEAAKLGAHVATMPPEVLDKMVKHPLTDIGLKRFLDDWENAGLRLPEGRASPMKPKPLIQRAYIPASLAFSRHDSLSLFPSCLGSRQSFEEALNPLTVTLWRSSYSSPAE